MKRLPVLAAAVLAAGPLAACGSDSTSGTAAESSPSARAGTSAAAVGHNTADVMFGVLSDAQLGTLRALSGTSFDRRFLAEMTAHHEGAVTMAEQVQGNGRDGAVRHLAKNIQTSQTAEIATMTRLLSQL